MNSVTINLLFDDQHRSIGEVKTSAGVLVNFVLNEDGEQLLGEMIREWQTQGIPLFREVTEKSDQKTVFVMFEDRVLMRDVKFLDAFRIWIAKRRYHLISVEVQIFDCWQMMSSLPLSDQERFAMIYALCRAPKNEIRIWKQALEQSVKAVEEELVKE